MVSRQSKKGEDSIEVFYAQVIQIRDLLIPQLTFEGHKSLSQKEVTSRIARANDFPPPFQGDWRSSMAVETSVNRETKGNTR